MGTAAGDRRPEPPEWRTRADPGSPRFAPDIAGAGPLAGTVLTELVVPSAAHVAVVPGVSLSRVLDKALETALTLLRADLGTVQITDPAAGALRIAVQAGFSAEFLQYFAVVRDDSSACGRAARGPAQVVIADVREDRPFAPHREIAAASGFRAVQSTPLVDQDGRLLGMLSTHYPRPYRPPAADLAVMRQLGVLLGQVMSTSWPQAWRTRSP
ncbi:MAG TPA: GAF domain-containing protein [Streptosporangiaceae bacterium]|nr:GAF domain-containing protein [Streptosporangiaceae bacterium]